MSRLSDALKNSVKDTAIGFFNDFIDSKISDNTGAQQYPLGSAPDWRVRLSLAEGTSFLYQGILAPLAPEPTGTNGVIFPYTPNITVVYAANYESPDLTHSNYKIQQYKNSAVDQISIVCDFTAQDTKEAEYLLAVIHFFRTVTKMFYGQDTESVKAGTPPPLCFLHGLGAFQFDNHPLVITGFTYNLPNDVDYIRAKVEPLAGPTLGPLDFLNDGSKNFLEKVGAAIRLGAQILPGGRPPLPVFQAPNLGNGDGVTYVPTKIQIQITAVPIVTRNDISNNFNLADYASGELLRGSRRNGGGIW